MKNSNEIEFSFLSHNQGYVSNNIFNNIEVMIDLNWKTNNRHEKLGSKRVATQSQEKTEQEYDSPAWKLKTDLDQSYEEQKVQTPNNQSSEGSQKLQVWSTILSDNHTTSIMQDHQKGTERSNHFFRMLKQKMPQYKQRSKNKYKLSLRGFERNPLKYSVRSVDFQKESGSLEKVKALRLKRRDILNEISTNIKEDEMTRLAELSTNKCLKCMCNRDTGQKHSRIELMKQMIFTLRKNDFDVEKTKDEKPEQFQEQISQITIKKKPGMMAKIVKMKNEIVNSQTHKQNGVNQTPCHLQYPNQNKGNRTPESSSCSRHKRMCQTQPLQFDQRYSSIDNQEVTPIQKVTTFVKEDQYDYRSNEILKTDNFTFGELSKNKMKNQLQLMQRHMKKVSIELQEKESQKSQNRRLFI